MKPDRLPEKVFSFVGGTRPDGSWLCAYRWPKNHGGLGFTNCGCARFDDGSCVPPAIYPEFARRRDAELEELGKIEIGNWRHRVNYQ